MTTKGAGMAALMVLGIAGLIALMELWFAFVTSLNLGEPQTSIVMICPLIVLLFVFLAVVFSQEEK
jgi:hypothetical protein